MKSIPSAMKLVLSNKRYLVLAIIASFVMFVFYLISPGFITTNSVTDLLWWQWFLAAVIAIGMGVLLAMQVYLLKRQHVFLRKTAATGIIGTITELVTALFATATCSGCVVGLLPFIGAGGVLFLIEYQWWIVAIGMGLIVLSICITSERICSKPVCR